MNNVEFLRENCAEALIGFEELAEGAIKTKYYLSKCVKEGNDKLIDEAIILHVKQYIGESYKRGVEKMKKGGLL